MPNTAARVGSINVLLSTSLGPAVSGLNQFAGAVDRTGARVAGTVAGIDRSVGSLNRTMGSISPRGLQNLTVNALRARTGLDQLRGLALAASAAMAGILPAGIAAGFVQVADRAHRMENSLRTVTSSTEDLKNIQEELFQVSQRSRSSFESTVTLYARTARATETLGLSQEKLLKITETVQKAFAIGGASQQEAQGAAIQLSQGIASNRFSGDEFRSVAENAPVLLSGMAKAMGKTIGELREMAHAGGLTADVVTRAILAANADIEKSYAKTTSTIMQAVQMVDNELLKFVSNSREVGAASSAIVGILKVLGDNVEGIATILVLLSARWGAAFGTRQVAALAAQTAAWRAQKVEVLKAAEAANVVAQAEHRAAQQTLASTRAAYEMSKANTVSASTRTRYGKELQTALRTELLARNAALKSAEAYTAASAAAGRYGMALGAIRSAGSSLLAFLGGPFGAALLAVGVTATIMSTKAAAAAERTQRLQDELRALGLIADDASKSLDGTAVSLDKLADDQLRTKLRDLNDELDRMRTPSGGLGSLYQKLFGGSDDVVERTADLQRQLERLARAPESIVGSVDKSAARMLAEIARLSIEGKTPVEDLLKRIDEIAKADLSSGLDEMIAKLRQALPYYDALAKRAEQVADGISDTNKALSGYIEYGRSRESGRQNDLGIGKMNAGRMSDIGNSEWEAEVNDRRDQILKAAKELGLTMTKAAATVQAEAELVAEGSVKNLGAAVDAFVNRVVKAESGGDRFAKNPNSSAEGLGQFINSTWLDQYKKVFANAKTMTDSEILALKTNSEVSKRLIENYARENAGVLKAAGISVESAADEYKLQLAHFLGPQGAVKVLSAAPGTPIAGLLDAAAIKANPTILGNGATTDDVIRYGMRRAGATDKDVGGGKKDAEDRFANSIEGVRDRIAALREEAAVLNLSYYEQVRREEALRLEQEALKQVREEARQKGDVDWRNAQISEEQRRQIDEVSRAYAAQATQTRLSKEEQEALNEAASGYGSVIRGLVDGTMDWKDALIEAGKILLKMLNDMNKANGGQGLFGGGFLQNLIGGFLGLSFHTGGTVGAGGNVVQFPSGAPYAGKFHGGGNFGGRKTQHGEVMALVKESENIFTSGQTGRISDALHAATAGMNQQRDQAIRVYVDRDGNWQAAVERIASIPAAKAAAKVASKVPAIIGNEKGNEWRRLRPMGTT